MAQRKLQSEIDRTLKKVQEGVELFESIFDKMNASTNATQKDKCETDLKTQIKKLQRLRDQIKTWISSSEIKDKNPLLENRKLIETQMERFKALEKEMKTKAFSKEGLIQAAKLDPAEKAKMETINWLSSMIDELARQVEASEAEIEVFAATSGKKRGKGPGGERIIELEALNERRKWHVGRMELIQRMVDNGGISVETVDGTKEDISYFVESNQEEDFEEDEGIYDELDLQEDDDMGTNDKDDVQSSHDDVSVDEPTLPSSKARGPSKVDDESSTSSGRDRKTSVDDMSASPVVRKTPSKKTTLDKDPIPPVPKPNFTQQPMASALKVGLSSTPTSTGPRPTSSAAPLPAIRYAAAAAAAVAPAVAPAIQQASAPAPAAPISTSSVVPVDVSPVLQSAAPLESSTPVPSPTPAAEPSSIPTQPVAGSSIALPEPSDDLPSPSSSHEQVQPLQQQQQPSQESRPTSRGEGARLPNALADLVSSFENAKQRSSQLAGNIDQMHSALDASFQALPHPQDAEKPRYYIPKNPYQTPMYYPQEPFAGFQDKEFYSKLDLDTLFYIFYYHANTYEQWLAARELKKQSWRFHKQYLTWFQRLSQPQAITDDYEQGMYIYFDWENSWCQRKKSDFRFEYRYLEEL